MNRLITKEGQIVLSEKVIGLFLRCKIFCVVYTDGISMVI
jgi:hypothetical protein